MVATPAGNWFVSTCRTNNRPAGAGGGHWESLGFHGKLDGGVRSATRSDQFRDWPSPLNHDRCGATLRTDPVCIQINIQMAEYGGGQILWSYQAVFDIIAFFVGAPDRLAMP